MAGRALRLDQLAGAIDGASIHGDPGAMVSSITHDSRRVADGGLFACVRGLRRDGHDYGPEAVAGGAAALLVERVLDVPVAQLVVPDVRAAMGPVAAEIYGRPADALHLVGVTGTNGKTTTVHLLDAVFAANGWPSATIGTLSGTRTTPEAPDLHARLSELRDGGTRAVAMEVSSHALALHRVDGIRFDVAVFTNLSRDHLEFHGNLEEYFAAKARLFTPALTAAAVVNLDDVRGRLLADAAAVPTVGYSFADAEGLEVGPHGSQFRWRGEAVALRVGGRFNVANALAAATAAEQLGIDPATIGSGLSSAPPVPGRFEPVDAGQPFTVIVDYAHTPDGIRSVVAAAREAVAGRVLLVVGAGGDRDPEKRPEMGREASAADVVVITSDNPRSEEPGSIIDDVRSGVGSGIQVAVEPDRRAAIGLALRQAQPGDIVVIAGKGHETTQVIGDVEIPFDDREVARQLLEDHRP